MERDHTPRWAIDHSLYSMTAGEYKRGILYAARKLYTITKRICTTAHFWEPSLSLLYFVNKVLLKRYENLNIQSWNSFNDGKY